MSEPWLSSVIASPVSRRTLLGRTGAGLLTMLVGESLTGCTSTSGGLENLPVIVAAPPAAGTHLPLIIKAKEFDKKEGVNVQLEVRADLTAYYNDLVAGQVPVNNGGAANIFGNMRIKGAPIIITQSSAILGQLLVVPEGSPISSTADLKGKRFTIDRAAYPYGWMLRIAKGAGVDLEKDVTIVPGGIATTGPLLAKGDADAAWMPSGLWEALAAQNPGKFKVVYDMGDELGRAIGVKTIYTLVGVREEFARSNSKLLEKMFTIWRNATSWANQNMDEAMTILAKPVDQGGTGLPRPAVEAQLVRFKTLRFEIVPAASIKEDLFKEFQAYVDVGFLEKLPDQGIIWDGLKQFA